MTRRPTLVPYGYKKEGYSPIYRVCMSETETKEEHRSHSNEEERRRQPNIYQEEGGRPILWTQEERLSIPRIETPAPRTLVVIDMTAILSYGTELHQIRPGQEWESKGQSGHQLARARGRSRTVMRGWTARHSGERQSPQTMSPKGEARVQFSLPKGADLECES